MINLYLVRHGKTDLNSKYILQGRIDSSLLKDEKENIENLALEFEKKNLKFDYFISSPLKRSNLTCSIIKNQLNQEDKEIIISQYFNERCFGKLQGHHFKNLKEFLKDYDPIKNNDFEFETIDNLLKRVHDGLNYLLNNYDNSTILLVTHSYVIKAILALIDPNAYNFNTKTANLNVTQVELANDYNKVIDLNLFNNKGEDKTA